MILLFESTDGHGDDERQRIKVVQWEIAERILVLGGDVVLDWGFWSRAERDDYRARAVALGARAVLRYLEASREELKRRLVARNAALPTDSFRVDTAELDLRWTMFDPPASEELQPSS